MSSHGADVLVLVCRDWCIMAGYIAHFVSGINISDFVLLRVVMLSVHARVLFYNTCVTNRKGFR